MESNGGVPRFGEEDEWLCLIERAVWEPSDDELHDFIYDDPGSKSGFRLGGRQRSGSATLSRPKRVPGVRRRRK